VYSVAIIVALAATQEPAVLSFLPRRADGVQVGVRDDGIGFGSRTTSRKPEFWSNIHPFGGALDIESKSGQGMTTAEG
jgi:signal transduction histidine kinase